MKIVTDRVYPDEPCWGLREGPRTVHSLTGTAKHWVQAVYVIRGDAVAEYTTDYGPAENFKDSTEVIYPSFGENSVAQLQELAERDRYSDKWARRRREMQAESTLIADILRQEEIIMEVKRNRSQFGPAISIQRIDFPREAVRTQQRERLTNARSRRKRTQG